MGDVFTVADVQILPPAPNKIVGTYSLLGRKKVLVSRSLFGSCASSINLSATLCKSTNRKEKRKNRKILQKMNTVLIGDGFYKHKVLINT